MAVECMFTGYWLADRCADHGRPCVLGPAFSMTALQGARPQTPRSTRSSLRHCGVVGGARRPLARRLRGVPPVPCSGAACRSRPHAPRAWRLSKPPPRPYPLPAMGTQRADTANRARGADRCAAPAGPKRLAVALARLTEYEALRRDVALPRLNTARPPDAPPLARRHTGPGLGPSLRLGRRYAIHHRHRCPRRQDCLSASRLGTCAHASAGPRRGTTGAQSGQAQLPWAWSAAAVWGRRAPPAAQTSRARLEHKQGQGTAVPLRPSRWPVRSLRC